MLAVRPDTRMIGWLTGIITTSRRSRAITGLSWMGTRVGAVRLETPRAMFGESLGNDGQGATAILSVTP